jgi:hypothetical protein
MSNRDQILEFLRSISPSDVTNEEIVSRTGIKPHQQVFAITHDLRQKGLIKGLQVGREWRFWSDAKKRASQANKNASASLSSATTAGEMTEKEKKYCAQIHEKNQRLRMFLNDNALSEPKSSKWFDFVTQIKNILGNINNDLGFLATLLAKDYLLKRFGVNSFDAAVKAQGAPGPDIEVTTSKGEVIRCELKTTHPYQPGFGAAQKTEILKDLRKLSACSATYKFMMVTDTDAFIALCKKSYASLAQGIEIVNLLTGESFGHQPNNEIIQRTT